MMLKGNQKLILQFNQQEQRWQQLQWSKLERRIRFPKLGAFSHAILDLRDEICEKQRPMDCISSDRIEE